MENNIIKKKLINEFQNSFEKLGLKRAKNLYVTSNLTSIASTRIPKENKLQIILKTLKEVMGKNYTIFSPSASMNLCNTNISFDLNQTPSYQMGSLAEYIRIQKNSVRSIHPFWSVSGIGKNSKILNQVSNHSYAYGSPWSKMLDLDTTQLNLGVHPSRAVTLVHHIEIISGVPYRFNKKFKCKIIIKKKMVEEDFFMSVFFKNQKIQKRVKVNEHFFNEMKKLNLLNYYKNSFGLEMWSFKMRDFFNVAIKYFITDVYNYLEFKPDLSYHNDL